ncbi:MAG: aminotransferase class III-fold pyridoxal phosphate-dependent enzyme, partial [Muribaculaceae bacterium]|nr:aminotransferase class III-fold pyridoxal phosphate-dependent enzyme [Muribaculaceae bacterium]
VKEVRGRGLMIGIEMERDAKELRRRLIFDQHIFTGAAGTNIIRLLPPLCVTKEDADRFIESFKKELKNEGYVG